MPNPLDGVDTSDDPYIIVSSDTHAGLFVEDYRAYLDSAVHSEFDEWLAITANPERIEPLRTVMTELAERGAHAGISLRVDDGALRFDHRWLIAVASK